MSGSYDVTDGAIASLWSHRRRAFLAIIERAGFTLIDDNPRDPIFRHTTGQREYLDGILGAIRSRNPGLEYDLYQQWINLSRSGEPERW